MTSRNVEMNFCFVYYDTEEINHLFRFMENVEEVTHFFQFMENVEEVFS